VVAKLFNLAHPDFAVFGQKDYQQAQVIKRMVRDLNFDLDVVVSPIVREPTGLARSSRNTYLSPEEKERALALSRSLASVSAGRLVRSERARVEKALKSAGLVVDYVEFVDGETLEPVKRTAKGVCVLLAVYDGKTRLIDNRVL
jgi:pantoate--beta-alanine ligase